MAYVYDNKTYRNLQQQVKENMDNIAELQDLKLVGIDVAGIVADYSSLPSSAEQGQLYAVGSSSPYELYVYNDSSWVDFGQFPKAGPQGEQGPQGEPGRQGPRGLTGPQGPRGYTGATGAQGPQGPAGERGPIGPQGPKGQDGTVSFDELTPEQIAMLKGPKGDQGYTGPIGPQGPQGIQGPQGEQGPQGIQGIQGPKGDKGDTGPQGPVGPQGPKGDTGEVPPDVATKTYVSEQLATKQDKLDSYSDSASVADDKLTINYKVKQEDGTYSNVPVEFQGGAPVDEKTIITNADGTISTALGGYIEKVNVHEKKFEATRSYKSASSGNWLSKFAPEVTTELLQLLADTKTGDFKEFIVEGTTKDGQPFKVGLSTQTPNKNTTSSYDSGWSLTRNYYSDAKPSFPVKLQLDASDNIMTFNDSISGISTISSVYYLVPEGILEIIHNADEKIVVGTSNKQIITGTKRFAKSDDYNIASSGRIEIGTGSYTGNTFPLLTIYADSGSDDAGIDYPPSAAFTIDKVKFTSNKVRPATVTDSISLGDSSARWNTLYCNNLSDGTTTKTMTDVLSSNYTGGSAVVKEVGTYIFSSVSSNSSWMSINGNLMTVNISIEGHNVKLDKNSLHPDAFEITLPAGYSLDTTLMPSIGQARVPVYIKGGNSTDSCLGGWTGVNPTSTVGQSVMLGLVVDSADIASSLRFFSAQLILPVKKS